MPEYVIAYLATVVPFLIIDIVWLKYVAGPFFAKHIRHLMAPKVNVGAAMAFYLLYVVGIVFFSVMPALADGSWQTAAINGAMLGLIAYGTFDMTNYASLRDYPFVLVAVDVPWGTVLTAASGVAGYLIAAQFI